MYFLKNLSGMSVSFKKRRLQLSVLSQITYWSFIFNNLNNF